MEINIKQIRITPSIEKAINNKELTKEFKENKSDKSFRLSRMDNMMTISDFDALLREEPIEVKSVLINGKPSGIKIDGKMKAIYDIVNGRHRFVRAILENKEKIPVQIINSELNQNAGKKKTKHKKRKSIKTKKSKKKRL